MNSKQLSDLISKELSEIYPQTELNGITTLILTDFVGLSRMTALLNPTSEIATSLEPQIYHIIEQLKCNRPIQYILGSTEFYGLSFKVNESVLIPRSETEELVDWIIKDWNDKSPTILDIGTGSGCIPVCLGKNLSATEISAIDISEHALSVARQNALSNAVNIKFMRCDFLTESNNLSSDYDVIVSNPPYIIPSQKKQMHANVLDHEPHTALFVPENDPLLFYKAIASFASQRLTPKGNLYLEINELFPTETCAVIEHAGLKAELRKDLNDKFRMIKASRHD